MTYVPDNAWHSEAFPFHFSAHLLPLFDLRVKLSTPLNILANPHMQRFSSLDQESVGRYSLLPGSSASVGTYK
jgi:hypothetical protein